MSNDDESAADGLISYNARLGLILFFVYLIFYAAFVYLSAFRGDLMAQPALAGVNLAVVYGFALILGAFLLAMVYMFLCKGEATERRSDEGS
jgi:uncharacterized membrane protein (DUF485 family)